MANAKLTLSDISDLRAYERERESFREHIVSMKKDRRVSIGPVVTMVFENRDTIRFQIQEMARAERMITDDQIQTELDIYNPLIPDLGTLSATLFIELTSKDQLMRWLPQLVGIEDSVEILLGEGERAEVVCCDVDPEHAARLTREEMTASVHYVHFAFTPAQIEKFATGPAVLAINHANYAEGSHLGDRTRTSLLEDLRGC